MKKSRSGVRSIIFPSSHEYITSLQQRISGLFRRLSGIMPRKKRSHHEIFALFSINIRRGKLVIEDWKLEIISMCKILELESMKRYECEKMSHFIATLDSSSRRWPRHSTVIRHSCTSGWHSSSMRTSPHPFVAIPISRSTGSSRKNSDEL